MNNLELKSIYRQDVHKCKCKANIVDDKWEKIRKKSEINTIKAMETIDCLNENCSETVEIIKGN